MGWDLQKKGLPDCRPFPDPHPSGGYLPTPFTHLLPYLPLARYTIVPGEAVGAVVAQRRKPAAVSDLTDERSEGVGRGGREVRDACIKEHGALHMLTVRAKWLN